MDVLKKVIKSDTGFVIVPVHYTHDPEKCSDEWRAVEMAKYERESFDWDKKWNREMELDFTAVSGAPAYPSFGPANAQSDLRYNPALPLCLCCDFNVEPMVWEVAQVVQNIACFIDEVFMTPGNVPGMIEEFRNRYPAHPAEIWVYGDATGRGRTAQTAKSYYDLIRLAMRGYPSPVHYRVPIFNPSIPDRINAFNLKLRGTEGQVGVLIDKDKCPELIKDLVEVVTKEDGRKIVKITRKEDPYFWRTHSSDSAGYFIFREWPTVKEVIRTSSKPRGPRRYTTVLGEM